MRMRAWPTGRLSRGLSPRRLAGTLLRPPCGWRIDISQVRNSPNGSYIPWRAPKCPTPRDPPSTPPHPCKHDFPLLYMNIIIYIPLPSLILFPTERVSVIRQPSHSRIYCWYAELRQRPMVLIMTSSTPTAAADVAAPIRKLWWEKGGGSIPAALSDRRTSLTI